MEKIDGVRLALKDAAPRPFWTDRPGAPELREALGGRVTADLVVVGGGFTGLWTALLAKERDPGTEVMVLEERSIARGAAGRIGGFISESVTCGLELGAARWPHELEQLLLMGRENLAALAAFVWSHEIGADLRLVGRTVCAVCPEEVAWLEASARLHERHGEAAIFQGRDEVQADVRSPTYLGGLRVRSGGGLVDPVALVWGMHRVAVGLGVRVHENTTVIAVEAEGGAVRVTTQSGVARARHVVVATSTPILPVGRLRRRSCPVHDHVLVTEPLDRIQLQSIGWQENQGLTEAGTRGLYYRRTPDGRILWGGPSTAHDSRVGGRDFVHQGLARTFFVTFPQLEGVRFSHRWRGGTGASASFAPTFGTTFNGRVANVAGHAESDVGAARFAASTMLDILGTSDTPRTRLAMVRRTRS